MVFIYLIGFLVTTFVGRKIFELGEKVITKVPIVRGLYTAAKKLTDAIFSQKTAFKRVVLVEFPLEGHYAIGFITTEKKWEVDGKYYLNIFIPTTPNPTSGWYIIVPEEKVYYLDLSVEEGLKALISAGIVLPEEKNVQKVLKEYIKDFQKK